MARFFVGGDVELEFDVGVDVTRLDELFNDDDKLVFEVFLSRQNRLERNLSPHSGVRSITSSPSLKNKNRII